MLELLFLLAVAGTPATSSCHISLNAQTCHVINRSTEANPSFVEMYAVRIRGCSNAEVNRARRMCKRKYSSHAWDRL